jgi:hypothetical protein
LVSQLSLSDVFDWLPPAGVALVVALHHDGRYVVSLETCCSNWKLGYDIDSAAVLHRTFDALARKILAERDAIHARRPNPCAIQGRLDAEMARANEAFRQGVVLARRVPTP